MCQVTGLFSETSKIPSSAFDTCPSTGTNLYESSVSKSLWDSVSCMVSFFPLHAFSFSPAHTSNICKSMLVFPLSRVCIYSVSVKPAMLNGTGKLSILFFFDNAHTDQCGPQSTSIQWNPIKTHSTTLLQYTKLHLQLGQMPKPCHFLLPLPNCRDISHTVTSDNNI